MGKGMKVSVLALALLTTATGGLARDYQLVSKGRTDARIQMNPLPSAPEFRAAKELQDYIKKISGADIVRATYPAVYYRVNGDKPDFLEILPITLEKDKLLMPSEMREKLSKAKSGEAFHIKTDGNRIIIGGKTPVAVLYGAYTFIEKYLGVRWFHPGADGEYCPKSADITLGEIDDFEEPSIKGREIGCWKESVKPWTMEVVEEWKLRNKIQFGTKHQYPNRTREELDFSECGNKPIGGGGHLTFESSVPKKLFATHPEYFPVKEGKRVCEERSQRCLSNPDVQKMVADYVLAMTEYGAEFLIDYHDSTGAWCHCPECVKMGTYDGKFTVSNLYHRFSGMTAENVLKRNPGAKLSFRMYSEFRDLPTDPSIHYDPRLVGEYCAHQRCYVHPLGDPKSECNAKFRKEIEAWRKLSPQVSLYDYYCASNSPYAPMEYVLAHDIKFYKETNLSRWYEDCTNKDIPYLSSNWQLYYVAARMLWDASLDADKLMDDAYDKYYGAAREPMKKYHAMRRELWESAPGHALYGGPTRIGYCLATPGAEKRLKGLLDEAEKLAGNDAVLKSRIVMDRKFLEQFWVAEADKIKKQMSGQKDIPACEATGAIKIDGALDEDDWRKAPLVTGFLTTSDKSAPVEETRVRVLYGKDNWYFGIEAMTEHAWAPLKADAKERDGNVFQDDEVEIFLMPPNSDYYHLGVNSAGAFYDAKVRAVEFDSKAEIKTKVLKDRYVIEARVPAGPMGAKIADGQVWRMHFYRACKNLQPPKASEGSSLDGTPPHEQTLFRRAPVGKSAIVNGAFERISTDEKTGKRFPFGWGGSQAALVEGADGKNRIELKEVIYSHMSVPRSEKGNVVAGEITASGKGSMTLWTSSCVRGPGDKRGFGHELKHELPAVALAEAPSAYPFRFDLAPYESGYLYIRVSGGAALIDCVSAARTEVP